MTIHGEGLSRTNEIADEKELFYMFDLEPGESVKDVVETHNGSWVREGALSDFWRFWRSEDDD